jgi:hypothetical protein
MEREETDCGFLYGTLLALTGRTVENHKTNKLPSNTIYTCYTEPTATSFSF